MANTIHLSIHRLLRTLQRRNHFIRRAYDTPLTPAESHLMVELDASPTLPAAKFARLLNLSPTFLSRVIASLRKKGYLKSIRDLDDGRRQRLIITPGGRRVLENLDSNANKLMASYAGRLTIAEQTRFRNYQ